MTHTQQNVRTATIHLIQAIQYLNAIDPEDYLDAYADGSADIRALLDAFENIDAHPAIDGLRR